MTLPVEEAPGHNFCCELCVISSKTITKNKVHQDSKLLQKFFICSCQDAKMAKALMGYTLTLQCQNGIPSFLLGDTSTPVYQNSLKKIPQSNLNYRFFPEYCVLLY